MKIRIQNLLMLMLLIFTITGCEVNKFAEDIESSISGTGIDGILSGSTVCIDTNNNGLCSDEEARNVTTTNSKGKFTLNSSSTGNLVLLGGLDLGTGLPFTGKLKAPAKSTVITPLTSSIVALVDNGSTLENAKSSIKSAMGIDNSVKLTEFDPLDAIKSTNTQTAQIAKKVLAKQAQVQTLLHLSSTTVASVGADKEGASVGEKDIAGVMYPVLVEIVKNFMDASEVVEITPEMISAATKNVANNIYLEDIAAKLAVISVSDDLAKSAVQSAKSMVTTIENSSLEDATDKFNVAITSANTTLQQTAEDDTQSAKTTIKTSSNNLLQQIIDAKALKNKEEAKIPVLIEALETANTNLAEAKAIYEASSNDKRKYIIYLTAVLDSELAVAEEAQAKAALAIASAKLAQLEAEFEPNKEDALAKANADLDAAMKLDLDQRAEMDARIEVAKEAVAQAKIELEADELESMPPKVVSATSLGTTKVLLSFNKQMNYSSLVDINNYVILHTDNNGAVSILPVNKVAIVSTKGDKVELTTSIQSQVSYTIMVTAVKDMQGNYFKTYNNSTDFIGTPPSSSIKLIEKEYIEPIGENCKLGGTLVQSGLDLNENNILEESEVTNKQYKCLVDCSSQLTVDPICSTDEDGDGLTYAQETSGWLISPDKVGYGPIKDILTAYVVKSNPDMVDSDGDGLNDYDEYLYNTNPGSVDTDEDGLSDYEEVNRWGTSPNSVDSDEDARGPNKDKAPNSLLFDGAELKIDFVNDPSHTMGVSATSPLHADTDGDGWTDYDEIIEKLGYGFNPTLADIPKLDIKFAGSPILSLTGATTNETSWSKDVAVSNSLSQSVSTETSSSYGTEQVIEATVGVGLSFGVEMGYEAGSDGVTQTGSASFGTSLDLSLTSSMATSQSISWTESQAREAEQAYEESMGQGGSEVLTIDGGYIQVPINLVNNGDITFTMTDLRVNVLARYYDGTSNYVPAMELQRKGNTPLTLAPGQKVSNIILISTNSDDGAIRKLLRNPSGLLFEVSNYTVTDAGGVPYGFAEQEIKQKTATVIIDYGNERPTERYLAAVIPSRSASVKSGIKISSLMSSVLNIPYEVQAEQNGFYSISKVRDVEADASLHKKWLVTTTSKMDTIVNSVEDIVLQAGDKVYFTFVKDEDADGISAREEFLNGTFDTFLDTDSDSLSDYKEIREGTTVKVEGELEYTAYSKGYNSDSDEDGLSDDFEYACGLDPSRADTDLDGISDYDELYGYDVVGASSYHIYPYAGIVIAAGINDTLDTSLSGDDTIINNYIYPGENGVIDSAPTGDDYLGVEHIALSCEIAGFATNPLNQDTDGDSISDGVEKELGIGNSNDSSDISLYLDTDNDGVSDMMETTGYSITVNGNTTIITSDPNNADTDNDGLSDLIEYNEKSNPRSSDTDADGLTDSEEYHTYNTSLISNDTDDDGLSDYIEVNGWQVSVDDGQPTTVTTDPLIDQDTDADGFDDYDEYVNRTNPDAWDTDGDGKNDKDELALGRSPIYKDRKITVTFNNIYSSGYCDSGNDGNDTAQNNKVEISWNFGVKRSDGTNESFSSDYIANNPDGFDKGIVGATSTFVLRYGETFEFYGSIKETDIERANVRNDKSTTDSGMLFYDTSTGSSIVSAYEEENLDPDYLENQPGNLKFIVGSSLNDTEVTIQKTDLQCVFKDNGNTIYTPGWDTNNFRLDATISFTVE